MAKAPTLARIRAAKTKAEGDDPGLEGNLVAGLCAALAVALLRPFTPGSGVWAALGLALVVLLAVTVGGLLLGLLVEGLSGSRRGALVGPLVWIGLVVAWERDERPHWYLGALAVAGVGGLAFGFKAARRRALRGQPRLPEGLLADVANLPTDLSPALTGWIDRALARAVELHDLLPVLGTGERAEVAAALETALRAGVRQVQVKHRLTAVTLETPALARARDEAEAALAALEAGLAAVLESAALSAVTPQAEALGTLRARADSLRASAVAWAEVARTTGEAA